MRPDPEFPLLSGLGLYASRILGDGNCLFSALSDQLYGQTNEHSSIRAAVIEHMQDNATYYKKFITVHPGGGTRRNPKRKNTNAPATSINCITPTQDDIDRTFAQHLKEMARGGTYGDNMEITAFSTAYNVQVKIYQDDFAYMVSPRRDGSEAQSSEIAKLPILYIAYHASWQHYSSIRNLDGPHSGPPHVKEQALTLEEEQIHHENPSHLTSIPPSMIKAVTNSLPFLVDNRTVKQTLQATNGSVDDAVSYLIEAEDYISSPSGQESSSIERDADSDDEAIHGPNKRRDRRPSTRTLTKINADRNRRNRMMRLAVALSQDCEVGPDTDDEHWHTESSWKGNRSTSASPSRVSPSERSSASPGAQHVDNTQHSTSSQSSTEQKIPTRVKIVWSNKPEQISANKSRARQAGPQQRRVSARDKKDIKKQAQKTARKQRAIAESKVAGGERPNPTNAGNTVLPIHTKFKTFTI